MMIDRLPAVLLAASLALGATPAAAGQVKTPPTGAMVPQPTPDADALAAEMRVLATDPKNVDALLGAGELTLKLGDPTAASVLFARAEAVSPNNGRLKADEAAGLVHMERPGEALRLFARAEALGYDPAKFAEERGLAYDLIGDQERAQRDYRLALKADPDDAETLRRYALSLGISGQRKQALDLIDPLVRRSDHAGWRDRAFILAMNGDADQANKIAHGMLPADMADGLQPFFERLQGLSPTDRAFAVHFGEVAATPERLADARLAPTLPALAPEAAPAQQLASAEPAPTPKPKKQKKDKKHGDRGQALTSSRTAYAATDTSAPVPTPQASVPTPLPAPVQLAANTATRPAEAAPRRAASPVERETRTADRPVTPEHAAPPTAAPGFSAGTTSPVAGPPRVLAAGSQPGSQVGAEDRILQNIIAGITVPASELGVAPVRAEAPPPTANSATATAPDPAAEAKRLEAINAATVKKAEDAKAKIAADRKAKAAAAKKAADDKAAAAKKVADAKASADKKAAEKKAKAEPSRIYVQVAGGANEHDLPKAWAAVKTKAPVAFKSKQGWSTPLNATNRVLAGPFKSSDAAQDFVNALRKEGLSGFVFTSKDGQKIDKLPAK
jgi:tetratricopeptide (TPR) repeat protein